MSKNVFFKFEIFVLYLSVILALLLLFDAFDFMSIFLCLELQSLSLYALTISQTKHFEGLQRKLG